MEKHKKRLFRRLAILVGAGTACGAICLANLISLEIIHGEEYVQSANQQYSYTRTIQASRGKIVDRNGVTLVGNTTMYALSVDYAMWQNKGQNNRILKLVNLILNDSTAELNSSLPITLSGETYVFSEGESSSNYKKLNSFRKQELKVKMNAEKIMDALCSRYEISDKKTAREKLYIAKVRYQMEREQFSMYNPFTMATNISMSLVTKVAEQHLKYPGVGVGTQSEREIATTTAGNILGYTGPIYAEDWQSYSEKGYSMNSIVGKTGAEKAFEDYLHGTDGTRTIQTDSRGNVISEEITEQAESGKTVKLTIDSGLQALAESSLASRCQSIAGAEGGAAVVINVKNGEILALANYPTYNPQTFNENYESLSKNALSPLLNRAIASTYAPGSTFKPVTAVAGLQSGVIDGTTYINDDGIYTYYADYQPKCWYYTAYGRGHGQENVVGALEDSCNYFFYETGRRLGGKKLEKYAKKFGLGDYTGIELSGEKTGTVAGPTERAEAVKNGTGREWSGGDVLQSAIGQGDNNYTPIQLANYCVAIANGGTVHSAHLLKAVMNYNGTKTVEKNNPGDLSRVKASDETWSLVREGMAKVTGEDGTAASVFENYSIKVAGKSGTAQRYGKQDNGLFISFAPYDDPEIAVCVVIEGGDSGNNVAPVVRDIYDYYFYGSQASTEEDGEESTADSTQETDDDEQSSTADTVRDWLNGLISG